MKHLASISKVRVAPAQTVLEVKLQGITDIIDSLLLAQRSAPWKAFFPWPDGGTGGTGGDTQV